MDGGEAGYLNQATAELSAAMEREKEGDFSGAIRGYRTAVDILITGVQGERVFSGGAGFCLVAFLHQCTASHP